jgi:Predicted alternative 3-dehydroquinate synthase
VKICWLDIRGISEGKAAIVEEAIHERVDGIVADNLDDLAGLPPTVTRVLLPTGGVPEHTEGVDVIVADASRDPDDGPTVGPEGVEFGRFVDVFDQASLESACESAKSHRWTVVRFRDPTKIPLEILLAAADNADGRTITVVEDLQEAEVVFGVLERGSDGVMLAPTSVGDATRLRTAADTSSAPLELCELEVIQTTHVGMGDRACVDTCTHLRQNEGILVGSHSKGLVLACSETHPLPYMPTRPFRVNAGAVHSYTLAMSGRTNYLSELRSGSKVTAVDVTGRTRLVTVGRIKIESRPLLSIDAVSRSGQEVNLIVQDDWHVRVLGPGGAVLNVTELGPGDTLLGHLPTRDRHVGYPIDEFCIER